MVTPVNNRYKMAAIVNPYSGNGRTAKKWPTLAASIEERIGEVTLMQTERPLHATELVREALRNGYDRIISVGGDGTHHEVLNGFFDGLLPINPRASMAILPVGTGSDLARTLNIPKGERAIPQLVSDRIIAADLGRVTFSLPEGGQRFLYFINTCHIGMGGAVVERVNRTTKKYGGFFSYFWGVLMTLIKFKNPYLQLDIDGRVIDQVCRDVVVAKGRYDGGGMRVAPKARYDNGLFEVYIIGDTGRIECVCNIPKLYTGRLEKVRDKVQYFRAARVTARAGETVQIQLDGEHPGQLPAAIEVLPKALNIVTACPDHQPISMVQAAPTEAAQLELELPEEKPGQPQQPDVPEPEAPPEDQPS